MSWAMRHSRLVPIAFALLTAGCGDSTAPPLPATKLAFVGQPSPSELGHPFTPAVQVAIQDADRKSVV